MTKLVLILYSLFLNRYWTIGQILFIACWILIVRKYKISGQKTAIFGFILLFITLIFSILSLDVVAGKIAEFVWILLAISFVQEFYHFLKYENK